MSSSDLPDDLLSATELDRVSVWQDDLYRRQLVSIATTLLAARMTKGLHPELCRDKSYYAKQCVAWAKALLEECELDE